MAVVALGETNPIGRIEEPIDPAHFFVDLAVAGRRKDAILSSREDQQRSGCNECADLREVYSKDV
jgi:hypothetical protein